MTTQTKRARRRLSLSQGRLLIALLKIRPYSSMELLRTEISTCWWKRVSETLDAGEELRSVPGPDGLLRYMVLPKGSEA